MRFLLDTHVLLWWLQDNPRLGSRARALVADADHEILISIASPWEISVKHRIGKIADSGAVIMQAVADQGMTMLDLTPAHLVVLEAMPLHHRDPFDHLILAQAQAERAIIVTDDDIFGQYGVRCVAA